MLSRQIAINVLKQVAEKKAYADIVLNNEFQKHEISVQDKRFIYELVHGTLRWQGKLDWIAKHFFKGNFKKCPSIIKYILRITLYQIIYLDNIPDYASINEGVSLAKKISSNYWANKVNAILRNFIRKGQQLSYPDINTNPEEHIAAKYSHPIWLIKRWLTR